MLSRCLIPERQNGEPNELVRQFTEQARQQFPNGSVVYTNIEPSNRGPSTGKIVLVLDQKLFDAWKQSELSIADQIKLVCTDLFQQSMHGYLALTAEQESMYAPDLEQLVQESLNRTSFDKLGVCPTVKWEVTVVHSMNPPYITLVISVRDAPKVLMAQ